MAREDGGDPSPRPSRRRQGSTIWVEMGRSVRLRRLRVRRLRAVDARVYIVILRRRGGVVVVAVPFFFLPFPRLNLKSYILPKTHEVITGNHYCLRWDTSAVIRDSTYVKGANVHEGSN